MRLSYADRNRSGLLEFHLFRQFDSDAFIVRSCQSQVDHDPDHTITVDGPQSIETLSPVDCHADRTR
jgi:hypothetical protein